MNESNFIQMQPNQFTQPRQERRVGLPGLCQGCGNAVNLKILFSLFEERSFRLAHCYSHKVTSDFSLAAMLGIMEK